MFTIFSVPKPFRGHIGIIQENAIRSWARLGVNTEVILCGAEQGTAEAARRLRVRHEPDIKCSEYGTPLVSDVFERVQRIAVHDWLCYVNCDIILTSDLALAVSRVSGVSSPVLMSGRRWRLAVDQPLEFKSGWEDHWPRHVKTNGWLDSVQCMDYFVFERGLFAELPEFAFGRTRWDSYLPYRARELGALLVDATDSVLAVHQDHGFAHQDGKSGMRNGVEGARNRELAGAGKCTLGDASHKLTQRRLKRATDHVRLRWRVFTLWRRPYVGFPVRKLLKRSGPRGKALLVGGVARRAHQSYLTVFMRGRRWRLEVDRPQDVGGRTLTRRLLERAIDYVRG